MASVHGVAWEGGAWGVVSVVRCPSNAACAVGLHRVMVRVRSFCAVAFVGMRVRLSERCDRWYIATRAPCEPCRSLLPGVAMVGAVVVSVVSLLGGGCFGGGCVASPREFWILTLGSIMQTRKFDGV
jgi:hypothetical protein